MYFPLLSLSLGEILKKACLNTLLGMGTVFAVLIFISLIISLFALIPKIQQRFTKKKGTEEAPEKKPVPKKTPAAPVVNTQPEMDDLELVAVITAAIAASTGVSEDSFIVRSIRRMPADHWTKSF
ncbi:MAG: OadG family protein [Lachnospiraceae bacterium]|nr:OadG family protein [Lachnospiraceae bacterium]